MKWIEESQLIHINKIALDYNLHLLNKFKQSILKGKKKTKKTH